MVCQEAGSTNSTVEKATEKVKEPNNTEKEAEQPSQPSPTPAPTTEPEKTVEEQPKKPNVVKTTLNSVVRRFCPKLDFTLVLAKTHHFSRLIPEVAKIHAMAMAFVMSSSPGSPVAAPRATPFFTNDSARKDISERIVKTEPKDITGQSDCPVKPTPQTGISAESMESVMMELKEPENAYDLIRT